MTAQSLLSTAALSEMIMRFGQQLGVAGVERNNLPLSLNARLGGTDPPVRAAAEGIAEGYGRRLGALLAMLRRGDPASRAARPEWDDSYWEYWARVSRVYLGGGLACGRLGELAARSAGAVLSRCAPGECAVIGTAHPRLLPLIGAARSVPGRAGPGGPALVLDVGHTAVKVAVASYRDGGLVSLHELRFLQAPGPDAAAGTPDQALRIAEALAGIVATAFAGSARRRRLAPFIVAAIAAYMDGGQPLPTTSSRYSQLRMISEDLGQWLSREVSRRLRRSVTITLVHDGTAAARALPIEPGAAVVLLGTALGVGYPCEGHALRPVSPGRLTVRSLEPARTEP